MARGRGAVSCRATADGPRVMASWLLGVWRMGGSGIDDDDQGQGPGAESRAWYPSLAVAKPGRAMRDASPSHGSNLEGQLAHGTVY